MKKLLIAALCLALCVTICACDAPHWDATGISGLSGDGMDMYKRLTEVYASNIGVPMDDVKNKLDMRWGFISGTGFYPWYSHPGDQVCDNKSGVFRIFGVPFRITLLFRVPEEGADQLTARLSTFYYEAEYETGDSERGEAGKQLYYALEELYGKPYDSYTYNIFEGKSDKFMAKWETKDLLIEYSLNYSNTDSKGNFWVTESVRHYGKNWY